MHFPAAIILDPVNVIEPPPAIELICIAAAVHPSELLLFSKRLVDAARKRRRLKTLPGVIPHNGNCQT